MRIYIAGPLTLGDRSTNVHRGIEAGIKMIKDGMVPFIPHLNDQFFTVDAETEKWSTRDWLDKYDLPWLEVCDALYRLDGESEGADLEVRYAEEHDIPIFYEDEYDDLVALVRQEEDDEDYNVV